MGLMDNGIIYQNHISVISVQSLYCIGGYVNRAALIEILKANKMISE